MFMSLTQRFITSTGHSAPAMIPVRSDDRSNDAKSSWFCIAMNIVGTPYTAVHRSLCTARSVAPRVEPGRRYHHREPCVTQPRLAITMPKQW